MAHTRRLLLGFWLTGLAFGGLLAGHFLGYAAAAPDPHARTQLLAATGHGSHGVVVSCGIAAALAGLIALVVVHLRARGDGRSRTSSLPGVGAALLMLQSLGFVALESLERGVSAHGLSHLLHEPAFLFGLAAQVVVAIVATLVVWLVGFTIRALLRLLVRFHATAGAEAGYPRDPAHALVGASRRAWNVRGPPRLSFLVS